jgi:outer membrane protein assembly factor BamB
MVDISGAENPQDYGLTEEQARRISVRYQLSPSQFRQQEERLQRRILLRIQFDDLPRRRAEFAARFLRGDDNEIAPDGYSRAADRLSEMRAIQPDGLPGRVAGMSVGPRLAAPLVLHEDARLADARLAPDNTGWKPLGPGNIGGRIRSILINPTDARNIYIGSVSGGVWITRDGGATWQPSDDLMANLAVCSMAMVSSGQTLKIYAGTGEGYVGENDDAVPGNGIFLTTDGWTWRQLENTKVTAGKTDFQWVNGIAANRNGNVILAGTRTGIFQSTDGGKNWHQRLSGSGGKILGVGNILFNPADDTKCVAGMLNGGGIYYSTDSGETWLPAARPAGPPLLIGRVQVCYAAAKNIGGQSIVYASVETFSSITAPRVPGAQIWASTDGGQSFTKKGSTINYLGEQGQYDNVIWAGDPTNSNFVIVGGIDLYKSVDGGNTLKPISRWQSAPDSAHADHHVILADPGYNGTSNKTVYFGNDGGLYKTTDVTTVGTPTPIDGWTSLNAKLPITQFYSVAGKFATAGAETTILSIVGGTQDNGTLRYTPTRGPGNWHTWIGGDGGYVASDPARSDTYYSEYVFLQIHRSTDAAESGEPICGQYWDGSGWAWKPLPYAIPDAKNEAKGALFIAPFALAPSNSSILYAGGSSLWRTADPLAPNTPARGPEWTPIKAPVAVGVMVSAIAVANGSADCVLVGYSNGLIYRSDDATKPQPSWRPLDGVGAARMCTSLVFDKNDETIYATFGGFEVNNIRTMSIRGGTWSPLGAALPKAPIYCLAIHPQNPKWLYVGTECGIFASEDGGQTWTPTNEGPTNCPVYQLAWMGNSLCCASHGRGMFSVDLTIRQQASVVLTGDSGGNLIAFDAENGDKLSSAPMASSQVNAAPLVDGTAVYCGYAQSPRVVKFGDGRHLGVVPAWNLVAQAAINATPCLAKGYPGEPAVLYVVNSNGFLTALNAASGSTLWRLQVVSGTGVNVYSNQMMNQWVYIATDKGLYAVNTQTRSVGWSKPYVCSAAPLLAANTVFAPTQNGIIYSVQARTGTENWNFNTGNAIGSAPVWVMGSVVVGNQGGRLVLLDYNAGGVQFSQTFANEQIQGMAADGSIIYFAGNAPTGQKGSIYAYQVAISAAGRSLKLISTGVLPSGAVGAPQVVGKWLYVTTTDPTAKASKLLAFDPTTGKSLWQKDLPSVARSGPALVFD